MSRYIMFRKLNDYDSKDRGGSQDFSEKPLSQEGEKNFLIFISSMVIYFLRLLRAKRRP